jgi:polar amino acid transport system substrate-binding protein
VLIDIKKAKRVYSDKHLPEIPVSSELRRIQMKFKVATLAILAALILAGTVYAGGRQERGDITMRRGVLSIGVDVSYPPMEYYAEDGKTPIGFDIDMGKAIAEKMGLRADFIDTAWDGIFAGLDAGRYDCIISSVTITPARERIYNFSKPYISNNLAMVVLKGSGITARTPMEAAGLNVAFQIDTTADHYMADLRSTRGLSFNEWKYDRMIQAFDELSLRRVDVVITDLLVAYDYTAAANTPYEIAWVSGEGEKFGICIRGENNALTEAIDKALDELFADGTMLRISRNVFGMDLVTAARQ